MELGELVKLFIESWVQFIGHLAWPLTILVILFMFRKPLEIKIRNILKAGRGDAYIEFAMEDHISEEIPIPSDVEQIKVPPKVKAMRFNLSNCRAFGLILLYILVKADRNKNSFKMREVISTIFPGSNVDELTGGALGMLMCFECLLPAKSVNREAPDKYTIKNIPKEFEGYLLTEINNRMTQPPVDQAFVFRLINSIERINHYFDKLSAKS